jgi:hypothetical protein
MAPTSQRKQFTKPVDEGTTKAHQPKGSTQRARQVGKACTTESIVDAQAARNAIMPKGTKMNLLPSALSSLRLKYFATLLAALFASGEPFNEFIKTLSTFHATCCTAFESVWPDVNITVETDNVLFNAVSLSIIIMKHS